MRVDDVGDEPQAAPPAAIATPIARRSTTSQTRAATRRCTSKPSTSAPTQKAAVCPMPNAATRAAPSVSDAPITMTATPDHRTDDRDERGRPAVAERVVARAKGAGTPRTGTGRSRATRARRPAARRRFLRPGRTRRRASSGSASAIITAETGSTRTAMRSSASRTVAANACMSRRSTSPTRSGRNAVRIGWASTAYGARKNTNATWYATTPPATELPTMSAAPSRMPALACSNTPHAERRSSWRISGSPGFQRGRIEKPLRRAATTRIATNAMTPPGARDHQQHPLGGRRARASVRDPRRRGTR